MRHALGALALATFAAAYFFVPYYLLKRGWIIRAGLGMLFVAVFAIGLIAIGGDTPGGGILIFLLPPLPLVLVFVGIGARIFEPRRRRDIS
jgi:hypothetical protein